MSRLAIVGSWPHRRQLRGREAVERALALCKAWPPGVDPDPDDNPRGACARAYRHHASRSRPWPRLASTCWLPPLVTALDREQLEYLLDGQPMGIDEVAS